LLAEDNEANIITISSYLNAKGYRIISAKNGKEAIAMTYAESPDIILMDIQMPEMDGLATIRQLRQDPNLKHIPIIALTALAMAGDRERCLEIGADDYLSKPVRLKELAATIHQLL
jgi:CheY-like chemotaxis protein